MNDALDQNLVTTTAVTQQTEPEVVAVIASEKWRLSRATGSSYAHVLSF